MTADLSDADRQFYISLIKGFDLDQARNACNDIEAREGTKLLVDGMDLEGMRRALLVHHGDGDGGNGKGHVYRVSQLWSQDPSQLEGHR